ncbi:nitroreductase family protein [Candidatus Woesearchaeota archaeon]|nr:nitroreductase family protein [Candidatus Woesearchaeota archaeon]
METLECIRTRRSIRRFRAEPVEQEKLGNILDAGRLAPSAGNLQAWKFVIITSESVKKKLADACMQQFWVETAPVVVVICSERAKFERMYEERGQVVYSVQSCTCAAMNMLLAAHDQGLGACYVGAFEEAAVKRLLAIPDDATPEAIIPIGYPDEVPEPVSRYFVDNISFIESWGNRIRDWEEWLGYHSHKYKPAFEAVKKAIKKRFSK